MTDFLRVVPLCFLAAVVGSCSMGLAQFNRTHQYPTGYRSYQDYKALRHQLAAKEYRGYQHRQLHFEPYEIRAGYGLYYAVMPGKATKFNVNIPCLISPSVRLMNTCYFEGKADGDTSRLIIPLDSALQEMTDTFSSMGNSFTQMDRDSLRKLFLYGGYVSPKPGYHIHFR